MFKVNDTVWIKSREIKGTVAFIEDSYIEIELENGSEMSFESLKDLEPYSNQVAKPKRTEKNWSEMFAERYGGDPRED